jgi:hypothetical protein
MKVGYACTQTMVSAIAQLTGQSTSGTSAGVAFQIGGGSANPTVYNTTSGGVGLVILKGQIVTHATLSGTFSIQHLKVTSGTSTIKIGSTLKIRKVA